MTLDRKEHDEAVLTDLADWLGKLDLVDEDEREGARENITVMVETLLSRLHAATAPSGQTPLEGVHSDDLAVDKFAEAMKAKLKWEREVRERGGWDDPAKCSVEYLARLLIEHLGKGNAGTFEDVANFAMMLHQRGADPKVLAAALPPASAEPVAHDLYKTGDADAPDGIKDRNGEIALGACRRCGGVEADLDGPCIPPASGAVEDRRLLLEMQAALSGIVHLIDIIHKGNADKEHILPTGPTVTAARRLADMVLPAAPTEGR